MKQHSGHDRTRENSGRLDDRFNRGVAVSLGLHFLMLVFVFAAPGLFPSMGENLWGSPDGGSSGISVSLVADVGGIALPQPEVVNETAAGNESEGFFEDEAPPPAPPVDAPDTVVEAEPIPETPTPVEATPPPPPPEPATPEPEPEAPAPATPPAPARSEPDEAPADRPDNAVPFGEGGQVALPFGQTGTGTGLALGGDGVFGELYGTYVDTIRKRISDEWIQGRIDSSVRSAPRVYVAFDIERDGEITNPRIEESSNNDQVDRSALRAVAATRRLSPLPREFRGARVSVRFWFELRR